MDVRKNFREFVIVVVIASVLVLLMNLEYFWKNAVYYFDRHPPIVNLANKPEQPPVALEPDTLWIESLGIKAPVLYVEKADENLFQKALRSGVVHYPGTALPGEIGNVYIFGHSSNDLWVKGEYNTIFALLPKIAVGAEILLTNSQGQIHKYVVTESGAVSAKAVEYLGQDTKGKKILTLQTSYPIGTSLKRWVVRAELVE